MRKKIRHATMLAVVSCWRTCSLWCTIKQWHQFSYIMLTDYVIMMFSILTQLGCISKAPANGFSDVRTLLLCLTTWSSHWPLLHIILFSTLFCATIWIFFFCLALPGAVYVPYSKIVFTGYIYHSRHSVENTNTNNISLRL